jgi:alpha-ketoglutarate-dependent taurine dioxygenase
VATASLRESSRARAFTSFEDRHAPGYIRPLGKSFACEVVGLRLWEPQDDPTIDEFRSLWARHPVLVFRRQALSE